MRLACHPPSQHTPVIRLRPCRVPFLRRTKLGVLKGRGTQIPLPCRAAHRITLKKRRHSPASNLRVARTDRGRSISSAVLSVKAWNRADGGGMEPFDSPTFRRLSRFVIFASWLSILIGLLGFAGWLFHVHLLKTILPGLVTIKANTAICFVLFGISLWLQRKEPTRTRDTRRWAARALALIIAVVGALSLTEAAFGWDLGIDQLLFKELPEEAFGSVRPGLMSQVTAANFLLLGLALLFLEWRTLRRIWPAQFLCWSVGIL